jgi:hypothetical protein
MKVMSKILSALGLVFLGGILSNAVQSDNFITTFENTNKEPETVLAKTKAVLVPENIEFASESVPVKDVDVFERLDKELIVNTYRHSNSILYFKRAHKYFPVIEPILKKNGIPDDFKYLAVIESGLENVISPAGAKGFWQIMPATGRQYGLEVNSAIDERYHIEKSTEAACKYLLDAKERFGSWTLAAASYNAGMYGIDKKLEKQSVEDYYNLNLNEETSRYIFRLLAIKQIMENPETYGFDFETSDFYTYVPNKKIEIDSTINNLTDFALSQGINYKILKRHNPWLLTNSLPNSSKRKYEIEIPNEGYYVLN